MTQRERTRVILKSVASGQPGCCASALHTTTTSAVELDCALTYKLSEDQEAAPVDRVKRELSLDEWKKILDKAWDAGIPHVIFTGGEPTLRPDLPQLIAHAEKSGRLDALCSLAAQRDALVDFARSTLNLSTRAALSTYQDLR